MSVPKYGEPWKTYQCKGLMERIISEAPVSGIAPDGTKLPGFQVRGEGMNEETAMRIVACVNALAGLDPSALAEVIAAAETALSRLTFCLENQRDCGDPDAECPLHDAHKDYDMAGDAARLRAALAKLKAEQP